VAIIHHGRIAAIDTPERLKETFRRVQSVELALAPTARKGHEVPAALNVPEHARSSLALQGKC